MCASVPRSTFGKNWSDFRLVLNVLVVVAALLSLSGAVLSDDGITCPLSSHVYDCPSCGLTGSLQSLVRGDLTASRAKHPAGVWIALWVVVVVLMRPLMWRSSSRLIVVMDAVMIFGGWIGVSLIFFR